MGIRRFWARSNVEKPHTSAEHVAIDFRLHLSGNEAFIQLLEAPYQLEPPTNHLKRDEVQKVISSINPNKLSGYDLITDKILKKLPIIGIR